LALKTLTEKDTSPGQVSTAADEFDDWLMDQDAEHQRIASRAQYFAEMR
jgi:hypothetical protein